MPTDEFFNTDIYTYLWVFNKAKAPERKDNLIIINASEMCKPLKKNRGRKRKFMDPQNRTAILKELTDFKDSGYAKVFNKWQFYYNCQVIMLANVDENGKTIESLLPVKLKDGREVWAKFIKPQTIKIEQENEESKIELTEFQL
jgi:type I restriction enzyme M protein